jgi:hypothetical protein
MLKTYDRREMRADDYTAETLEKMADQMPPGYAEQAAIMRGHAQKLRASSNKIMIEVWEEAAATFQKTARIDLPRA